MKPLLLETSFREVIPKLARSFGDLNALKESVLDSLPEAFFDLSEEVSTHYRGELSPPSTKALYYMEEAILAGASLGHPSCLWFLGVKLALISPYPNTTETALDLEEDALRLLMEASEGGEPRAEWMLGERFSRMKDGLEEAVRLLGKAAAQGFEPAKERLMELFERRFTFTHAPSEAKWLLRFAEAGVPTAQFDLANERHLRGDLREGFFWMLRAAQAGHHTAQERVAFFYEIGEGCAKNPELAAHWRDRALGMVSAESPSDEPIIEIQPQADAEALTQSAFVVGAEVIEPMKIPEPEPLLVTSPLETELPVPVEIHTLLSDEKHPSVPEPQFAAEQNLIEQSVPQPKPQEPVPIQSRSSAPHRPGFGARFRDSLAGFLRLLADKVSGVSDSENEQ